MGVTQSTTTKVKLNVPAICSCCASTIEFEHAKFALIENDRSSRILCRNCLEQVAVNGDAFVKAAALWVSLAVIAVCVLISQV